jgi:hypothetical protein
MHDARPAGQARVQVRIVWCDKRLDRTPTAATSYALCKHRALIDSAPPLEKSHQNDLGEQSEENPGS